MDAAVRDRIYVSSRTPQPKNGLFANEEESIYGHAEADVSDRIRICDRKRCKWLI
jgi:hypothetical protein